MHKNGQAYIYVYIYIYICIYIYIYIYIYLRCIGLCFLAVMSELCNKGQGSLHWCKLSPMHWPLNRS